MFNHIKTYISVNIVVFTIAFYFIFSAILKALTNIDICIPCVWKSLFNFNCPGCGLTTAFVNLLKFNFVKAFENNWLIFIIIPSSAYYVLHDFKKYKRK